MIVEYRCMECGWRGEILVGRERLECKRCGSRKIERVWSGMEIGLKFVGSGFYENDYKVKR